MIVSPSREESLAALMGCELHNMIIQIDAYGKPYSRALRSTISWEDGVDLAHCTVN